MEGISIQVKPREVGIALLSSILIILFLFFIDEGAYNFNWMKGLGNWIAFIIYITGFSLGQYLTYRFILAHYNHEGKLLLTNILGIPLGFGLVLLFFYIFSRLYS